MASLSHAWQKWIAENLASGVPAETVEEILTGKGFRKEIIAAEVAKAARHPYVEAAKSIADQVRKRDWVFETLRKLETEITPEEIPDCDSIGGESFFENFYFGNRPLLIREAIDENTGTGKVTPEFLESRWGDQDVEIQAGRESDPEYEVNSKAHKKRVRFSKFLEDTFGGGESNDYYLTANNSQSNGQVFEDFWEDIDPLPEILDESIGDRRRFLWIGPSGIVTPLHHDLTNNLMLQLSGEKRITLISPMHYPILYNYRHCFSRVDLENVDEAQFPRFCEAKRIEVTLKPGQALFLPVGWWHHVRGLSPTITLTFTNFRKPNHFPRIVPPGSRGS